MEQGVSAEDVGTEDAGVSGPDQVSAAGTRITLLVGVAELAEEIDADRARVALEAGQARVTEITGAVGRAASDDAQPDADLADAEAAVLRAEVRLEATDASSSAST